MAVEIENQERDLFINKIEVAIENLPLTIRQQVLNIAQRTFDAESIENTQKRNRELESIANEADVLVQKSTAAGQALGSMLIIYFFPKIN